MATTCTFKSHSKQPNGVTTESSGTLSLNDVTVHGAVYRSNPQTHIAITANSIANPSVVTTALAHGLATGDYATIEGSNSTPSIDGEQQVTVISSTTFSVAVNVTVAGVTGKVTKTRVAVAANLQPQIYVNSTDAATAGVAEGWYRKVGAAEFRKTP